MEDGIAPAEAGEGDHGYGASADEVEGTQGTQEAGGSTNEPDEPAYEDEWDEEAEEGSSSPAGNESTRMHEESHRKADDSHDGTRLREGEYNTWGIRGGVMARENRNKSVIQAQIDAAAKLPGPGAYDNSVNKKTSHRPVSFTAARTGRGGDILPDMEEGTVLESGSTLSNKSMSISKAHSSRNYLEWPPSEVQRWLQSIGLKHLGPQFMDSEVSGSDLAEITPQDLQETLPIKALHDRQRLLRELNILRGQYSITNPVGTANVGPGKYDFSTKEVQQHTMRRTEVGGQFNLGKPMPIDTDLLYMEGAAKPGPGEYPYVTERQIHFMHSKLGGGVKFTTGKSAGTDFRRKPKDEDGGPGPAAYILPPADSGKRAPRFGKTKIKSSLDEIARRSSQIPGPADYNPGTHRFDVEGRAARGRSGHVSAGPEQGGKKKRSKKRESVDGSVASGRSGSERGGGGGGGGQKRRSATEEGGGSKGGGGGREEGEEGGEGGGRGRDGGAAAEAGEGGGGRGGGWEEEREERNAGIEDPDQDDADPGGAHSNRTRSMRRGGSETRTLGQTGASERRRRQKEKRFVVERQDLHGLLQELYHMGQRAANDEEEQGSDPPPGPGPEWEFTLGEWQAILRKYGLIPHYMSTTDSVHVYSGARRTVLGRNQRPRQMHRPEPGEGKIVFQVALRNLAQRLNLPVRGMDMPKLSAKAKEQAYRAATWHDGSEEHNHMQMELRACAQVDAPLVERYLKAVARRQKKEEAPSSSTATLGEFNSDWVRGKDEKMRRMRIEADQHTEEVETTMKGLRKRFSNAGIKGWKA